MEVAKSISIYISNILVKTLISGKAFVSLYDRHLTIKTEKEKQTLYNSKNSEHNVKHNHDPELEISSDSLLIAFFLFV